MRYRQAFSLCLAIFIFPSVTMAQSSFDGEVSSAVANYACYSEYWGGGSTYDRGKTFDLIYVVNQRQLFARIDGLVQLPRSHMVTFFQGASKDAVAVIWNSVSYNKDVMSENPYFLRDASPYEDKSHLHKMSFNMPARCNMKFDSDPLKKKAMIDGIEKTLIQEFTKSGRNLPSHAVVADFDVNYPQTFVYIPDDSSVFLVQLHDLNDYFNETTKNSEYPISLVGNGSVVQALIDKIKRHALDLPIK